MWKLLQLWKKQRFKRIVTVIVLPLTRNVQDTESLDVLADHDIFIDLSEELYNQQRRNIDLIFCSFTFHSDAGENYSLDCINTFTILRNINYYLFK